MSASPPSKASKDASMATENKSDLNYWIFDKEYPLHSNAAVLNIGSAGAGKSYFTYKYLLPIYIKYAGIKTILICSRSGNLDYTTATELKNPIYKDIGIEFIKIDDSFSKVQMIRADAIINEYLLRLMEINNEKDLVEISKDLQKFIKNTIEFRIVHSELTKLLNIIHKFMSIEPEEVRDYAEMLFKRGTQLTFNPILIVYDDMSGNDEFIKPYSDVHKLIYCRRHMHCTMIMNVQSLTTISTNIRRNSTAFICFSTLSEKDVKLLSDRAPIRWTYKQLYEAFLKISDAEDRSDKVLTMFTTFPNQKVVIGTPACLKQFNSK